MMICLLGLKKEKLGILLMGLCLLKIRTDVQKTIVLRVDMYTRVIHREIQFSKLLLKPWLFTKYIPDFGDFVSMIDNALTVEWIKNSVENGHILSNYDKYVYTKGDNYYYHIIWYYRADDGLFRQITCAVKTPYSN